MSGGSYNYLCLKVHCGLLAHAPGISDLEEMIARLDGLGYADDVAREARSALAAIHDIDDRLYRLEAVFEAVEWWDSCDRGEDDVREALTAYRGEPTDTEGAQ